MTRSAFRIMLYVNEVGIGVTALAIATSSHYLAVLGLSIMLVGGVGAHILDLDDAHE